MILVDTANLKDIAKANSYPFVTGITTNPKLISKELGKKLVKEIEFFEYIKEISKTNKHKNLFIQTNYSKTEDIIEESKKIIDIIGKFGVIKIPVTHEGIKAIKVLSKKGIRCAATALFTPMQAQISMLCGAEFVIPYYSRLEHSMQDALQIIRDILCIIDNCNFDCRLLVASIKNPFQVFEIFREGAHYITIPIDLAEKLVINPNTQKAITDFNEALKVTPEP